MHSIERRLSTEPEYHLAMVFLMVDGKMLCFIPSSAALP